MKVNWEVIKNFIVVAVVPPLAGGIAVWLSGTKVFQVLGISADAATKEIGRVLTFGIVSIGGVIFAHNHLLGNYSPGAKAARAAGKR